MMLTRLFGAQGHQRRSAGGVHVHVRLSAAGHPHPHLRREEAQRFSSVAGTHRSFLWFRPLLTQPLLHHNAVRCAGTVCALLPLICGRAVAGVFSVGSVSDHPLLPTEPRAHQGARTSVWVAPDFLTLETYLDLTGASRGVRANQAAEPKGTRPARTAEGRRRCRLSPRSAGEGRGRTRPANAALPRCC